MKIVIVLCSIATFAIAVPVHQEKFIESSLTNQLVRKRESISSLPGTSGLPPEDGIEKSPIDSSKKSGQGISVEAKGFKRPIIIKRKFAYHVYRDSDEEMAHAEPGERCREQVKFKLCDHEPVLISKNGINTPTFKCVADHKTDNVMKNSIKMTKEAVEHLQRDLKRMENFSPKMVSSQIEDIESNFGLYHDIEIAREAIEHIEQNFKSVNSEVNKFNELQIPKSQGEERLNRWREAIDNIHKNFEIMKNIEDAFKSDNLYSTIQPNARKANQPEAVEHSFHDKFINDNLDNTDDDVKLKSPSNKVRLAQPTLKNDNLVNIGKDAENDIFISSSDNREENKQLHSDSLKSEISSKDASLGSDGSKMESEKQSTEFSAKNSNTIFEVPKYSEHEKTTNDHISDEYELLPKVSSSSLYSLHENEKNEEKKTLDKSQLMMKTALQEKENRNPIIKMKTVKEILENKKDQLKTATSNEENINNYEEMFFKSNNKNSPLEELSAVPMSRIAEASGNLEYGSEEKKYSDKEQQPIVFNTNMRLSNDQLEKVKPFPVDSLVTKDQYVTESSHVFPLNAKNAFSGEDNSQKEHKNKQIIKENQVFNYPQDSEIEDEVQKLKNVLESNDEYKSIKSSDGHDKQESLRKIQNKELKNDDSLVTVVKTETEFYKTVSDADNEDILNDREQSSHQHIKEQMPLSVYQSKDANQDPKWLLLKSVPELPSELTESLPTDRVEVTDDQQLYKEKASMTSSENQNEKIKSNENQEMQEHLPMRLDNKRHPGERLWQSPKSVDGLLYDPTVSISRNTDDITDDKQSYKEEASMRSSEKQFENMELDENQKVHVPLQTSIYIKNAPEGHTWQFSKSVPELNSDLMVSMPTDTVDITNDQHSIKEDPSMRSSQIQNDLLQLNGNQEFSEPSPPRLNGESYQEEHISQFLKSVPELQSHRTESLPKDEVDVTDDQQSYREKASMRSLENQNENMQSNENRAMQEHLPTRLDNERHSEERSWQSPKSVDEVIYDPTVSISRNTDDITDDKQSYKEEASVRSSGNQNENMHSNENREMQEHLPTRLDNERHSEERSWQSPKSVDEVIYDPTVSISRNTDDITDDKQSYKEEASLRSSGNQNENMHSNENRKMQEYLPTRLDNERHSEERSWQSPKSVDELIYDPTVSISRNTDDIMDDKQPHKEEASLRSSEYQNEHIHSNENRAMQEHLPTRLDNERHSEERSWQSPKSVDEVIHDPTVSISRNTDDITDDKQSYKEEASLRSSENQNENMHSNENLEMQEHLPTRLDNERHSEERSWQSPKSVDEVIYDPTVSISKNTDDITDDKQFYKEEASLRSSGNQNENRKMQEYLPTRLDNERHSEERSSQSPKSVDEVIYDPTVSISRNTDDITDDKQSYKEEASLRSSENQNENMQSNENRAMQEHLPTRLDNERHSEERSWQSPKSVDEVIHDPTVSISRNTDDITDDKQSYKEEASLRSSGNQNENMQSNENRAMQEHLPTRLDNERHSEERSWQSPKSVDEVIYDPKVSISRNTDDITDDKQSYKEEASLRSSEYQNEHMQSNENQEMQEHLPTRLDNERHSEERSWQSPKSVDEVIYDPTVSISRNTDDITDDKQSYKEEASLRSSGNQNENMQSNENRAMQEHLPTRLDNERHSEERSWQSPKSVDEVIYDPKVSISRNTDDITDDKQSYKEEASLRSSEYQNEHMQSNENQEMQEHLPTRLDNERHSEERSWQSPKSVDELSYDAKVPSNFAKMTDNQNSHKEIATARASDKQFDKMQSNENLEAHEALPMRWDIETRPEKGYWQSPKFVDELSYDPMKSMPTKTADVPENQYSDTGDASIRLSENQNKKLAARLSIENNPEDRTGQYSKAVSEPTSDRIALKPADIVDVTGNQHLLKGEGSMRLSQSQNEKLQLNEYQEEPKSAATNFDIENSSEDKTTSQLSKSASESQSDQTKVLFKDTVDITDDQHSREASMRSSENKYENIQPTEGQETHETLPTRFNIENHPEDQTWQMLKSVPESTSDSMGSMPTDKSKITKEQQSINEGNMRLSQDQNYKWLLNEYDEGPKYAETRLENEKSSEDTTSQLSKSAFESQSDQTKLLNMDTVDITKDQNSHETSMRSSENKYDKIQPTDSQEIRAALPTRLNIENHPEDQTWQMAKSVPESSSNSMVSTPTDNVEIIKEQHSLNEGNMRIPQNQKEKLQLNEYEEEPKYTATRLENEKSSEDTTSEFSKSASESPSDQTKVWITETVDITNDQHSLEASMRSSEMKYENIQPTESQEIHETLPTRFNIENYPEDQTWQMSKSVPESTSDSMVSMPTDNFEITKEQHSINEGNMRLSQNQNDKWLLNEYEKEPKYAETRLENEKNSEDTTSQLSKSASETQSDQTKLFNTDAVDITNDQNSHEANMRSSENKYDKIQPTDSQEIHAALPTRLNIENYQMSKSVPESTSDPMVSMPTESFNMRVSQNQNDRSRFDEINSEHSGTSQFFKSAPESYMTPTDLNHVNNKNTIFKEEARLSQNPNEEQHINLNHYLYDPLWAISNGEKSLGDDSSQIFKSVSNEHVLPIAEHKEKFSFTQDPINDQTYMRFSQNQNEKNEIQYPRVSLGFSNLGYINKEDNTNVMHDDLRVAHPQQLYENSDPILESSNDRQHLSENFQTLSDYKMLSPKSQLKYSNGQNAFNEHLNMGINQQQSRDPQSVENHNFHNLLSMRLNTENQHRDPSPKTFQPNTGFDHTLHRGKQFDYDHTRPELYGDRVSDNTQSRQWFTAKQHNDNFLNYYKTIPEAQEEYLNPYYNQHLHRVPLYHGLNDGDTFSSSDFPSSSARLHDHMQKYHQEKASNVDSPIQPSMHMNMREPFAISGTEVNNEHFNHPHGTARFGTALPIGGIGSGAMGVFPTANAGCGIPLLLSCNPSVISGSLARSHIGIPGFKSVDENYKYYMKRNAKNIEDVPDIDVQKASAPHNPDKDAVTGI